MKKYLMTIIILIVVILLLGSQVHNLPYRVEVDGTHVKIIVYDCLKVDVEYVNCSYMDKSATNNYNETVERINYIWGDDE